MSRPIAGASAGLFLGVVGILLYLPLSNPCILNFDPTTKPVQLANPTEQISGLVACDYFPSTPVRGLTLLLLPLLLLVTGAVAVRVAKMGSGLLGGVVAATATLLGSALGYAVYPWLEVYWLSIGDLALLAPIAFIIGGIGGWFITRYA